MKYTLHMRARKQHILVEDLPLDVQFALLGIPLTGIGMKTDITRTIDIDMEMPIYPLTQEAIEHLNAKRRIHEYRSWHITREEDGVETTITPEQALLDAKEKAA